MYIIYDLLGTNYNLVFFIPFCEGLNGNLYDNEDCDLLCATQ